MANMTYTEAGYQHSSQLNLVARVKMSVLSWLERSRRRRRKRRGEGQEAGQSELSFDATATGQSAPTEGRRSDADDDTANENEAKPYVSLGKRDDVSAGELNRLFIDVGGVPADQVGRIRVRDRHSFVFLPREVADAAVAKLNGSTQRDRELVVEFARK